MPNPFAESLVKAIRIDTQNPGYEAVVALLHEFVAGLNTLDPSRKWVHFEIESGGILESGLAFVVFDSRSREVWFTFEVSDEGYPVMVRCWGFKAKRNSKEGLVDLLVGICRRSSVREKFRDLLSPLDNLG